MYRSLAQYLAIMIACASMVIGPVTVTNADTIGVNFNNGQFTLLDPTDLVGVVPSENWNNFANNGGIGLFNPDPTELYDSTGSDSGATIAWEVGSSYFNSNNGVGNQRMMEGWFGLNADDLGYIEVEGLSAAYTDPSYDLYVYFDSDQVAPNERTMTFTLNDATSITGKEFPANFTGTFYEAIDGGTGNFVIFRDLTDSSFTLNADSDAGRASINGIQITTEPEPDPVDPPDPNDPIHVYDAAADGNTDGLWLDSVGNKNWTIVGGELNDVSSANTILSSAYQLISPEQGSGGDTTPFESGDMTYEIWVRPEGLSEDHQVVFETGGGQNGTSIMMTENEVRLLNSTGNGRQFDMTVPLSEIDTSDFVQIVAALNDTDAEITLSVNGAAGGSASDTEVGDVGRGGNRASLFTWGSGVANLGNPADQGGGTFNLGGRTELDDMTPEGLTQFSGEIALLKVYSRAFTPAEVQAAYDLITSGGIPGDYNRDGSLDVLDLNLQTEAIATGNLEFDENNDDLVNYDDRYIWVHDYKKTWIGDADLNGEFSSGDLVKVFVAGKYETGGEANWDEGDWNGDGVFESDDMIAAFVDGGYEQGPLPPAVSAVPEPAGALLLLAGLMGLCWRRCRT
jgi:hypothetical protein